MTIQEKYARTLCQSRGAEPDQPITIVNPDGTSAFHKVAWKGYTDLADALLALHDKEPENG